MQDREKVLREVIRNYLSYESYCSQTGQYVFSHRGLTISFLDLQGALKKLSPRKREAVFYNVILDQKQKDVAKLMGITTVSVGQYVQVSMSQVAKWYFDDAEHLMVTTKPVEAAE